MTTAELYDLLEGDTALAALLGTFTFRDGSTAPALSRLWPNEPRDQHTRCSGVEVSIGRLPATPSRGLLTGETMGSTIIRMFVTQWAVPAGDAHHLDGAVARILVLLRGQAEAIPAGLPDGLTGLGQVVIRYVGAEDQLAGPEN
jgi:hypothetical protein